MSIMIRCETCGKLHRYKEDRYLVFHNNAYCDSFCKNKYIEKIFMNKSKQAHKKAL